MQATGMSKWEKLKAEDPGKKRDFQVRVHVIEARELQPRDANGMSDPVCVISVLNKKNNTKTYHNTTICTWDHLMFFQFSLTPDEFFLGKIKATVFDANTIMRNVEIGSFEFDIGGIYEMDGHELYRKWVGLVDSSGKFENVQGFLKLSVTVLAPGEEAPAHTAEEEDDEENDGSDLQSMVLLPPSVKTEIHTLELNFYRAEALPKMDIGSGKCDGYVAVKYGANPEIKTEVIKNTYSPTWTEKLIIPVTTPTMTDLIKVQVRDWDQIGKDDIVATFFLRYSEIANQTGKINWKQPRWVNLYGTPEGVDVDPITKVGKMAAKMLDGGIEGCAFRGRLLLSAESHGGAAKLSKTKVNAPNDPPTTNYALRFDLYEAAELQTKAKIAVELAIGSFRVESKKMSVENGASSWYFQFDEINLALPRDKEQLPDIFIDIIKHSKIGIKKKKRIGYIRVKANEIDNKAPPRWELIQPDIFREDEDNIQIIGFLQYKLQLGTVEELGRREALLKPKMKKYQLRAHIYQGRDLPAADANGLSDPYVVVRMGKYSAKTKIIKKTLFPLWYETLQIPVEIPENLNLAPEVNVSVYDWDQLGDDDYLGRFSCVATKLGEAMPAVPTWNHIYMKNQSLTEGEILASFQLIPEEKISAHPAANITPRFKDCIVELSLIGCRNLLPYRLLPISKPYVEVDTGSETIVRSKISSNPNGANPNFLETIELEVKLPASRLFAPPINIRVYDDRGIYKALVATRSISLAPFITWDDSGPISEHITVQLDDDDDTIPKKVTSIPGASGVEEVKEDKPEISVTVPLEEPEEVIVTEEDRQLKGVKDAVTKAVDTCAPSRVAESMIPGLEAEPEEKKTERDTIKNELELNMSEPTFNVYKLYRAKKKNGRSIQIEVGQLKGRVRVFDKADKGKVDPPMDLVTLFKPTDYVLRAYILEGFQLVPKDRDGKNNPYIRIKCGKTKIKDVNQAKQGTSRPQFFKCYEIPITFPANTTLDIGVWDYDKIGSDDLIGGTKIDLENRIFSNEWKNMKFKPIEFRTLWTQTSTNPQGQLKLWIDILTPDEARKNPPEPIEPPTPIQYELRAIIWETKDVVFKDKNMSDIFVVAYPEGPGQKPQVTDTHWRSEDGLGKFNWRMKFPVVVPNPTPRLKVQVWDKDILSPNDAICECNLNLKAFYNKMHKNKSDREAIDQQWIAMTHPAFSGVQGQVLLSLELLSQQEVLKRPAGFGRKEPNENPHLDPPDRPETSFNPLRFDKMISKVVWGQNKGKFYAAFGGCFLVSLLILILVFII